MALNALTIDVEDWFHPELVRDHLDATPPSGRVEQSLRPLLELLDRHGVKATFFFLGDVVTRLPDLLQQVHARGHEIACHGMSHRMLKDLGEEGFRKELQDFSRLVSQISGDIRIKGFRAPTFSLCPETKWALPILRDFGYVYDSSLFPAKLAWNRLYGVERAPTLPYRISFEDPCEEDPSSPLWEFPAAVTRVGNFPVPASGGFYLRVLPVRLFTWALKRINREGPFYVYVHPWECDAGTPRVSLPLVSRWITYYGMHAVISKLERLLDLFSFSRMDEVLEEHCRCRI